jgi:hypothetical protein
MWYPPAVIAYLGAPVLMQANQSGAYTGVCVMLCPLVALSGVYDLSGAGNPAPAASAYGAGCVYECLLAAAACR